MPLNVFRGVPLGWRALESNIHGVLDMEVRDSDVFVVSYPKSGNHWLRNIIKCILHSSEEHYNRTIALELSMCSGTTQEELEAALPVYKMVESWTSPRVMYSHLMPHLLPTQLHESKGKVVCIARNPKDVAVSFYHFFRALKAPETLPPWDEFVNAFVQGEGLTLTTTDMDRNHLHFLIRVPFGSYFTHVKRYWEMRDRSNFLFVKYEDLKKDSKAVIKEVGSFLGRELEAQEISDISDQCSFQNMRKQFEETPPEVYRIFDQTKLEFMRKGQVGGWRESLTVAQSERFDQLYDEHFGGTGLTFDFG